MYFALLTTEEVVVVFPASDAGTTATLVQGVGVATVATDTVTFKSEDAAGRSEFDITSVISAVPRSVRVVVTTLDAALVPPLSSATFTVQAKT